MISSSFSLASFRHPLVTGYSAVYRLNPGISVPSLPPILHLCFHLFDRFRSPISIAVSVFVMFGFKRLHLAVLHKKRLPRVRQPLSLWDDISIPTTAGNWVYEQQS